MNVEVPDIGDFTDVPVIEILVAEGDEVTAEQALITLESDKATMEVPSPAAGTITKLLVDIGDKVSQGTVIAELESKETAQGQTPSQTEEAVPPSGDDDRVDVVILGAGPGGYTAAFRAADLGLSVTLVERYERLGGVCLNVGCIPSKALLHLAKIITEAEEATALGFKEPEIDVDGVRAFKDGAVDQLTGGLDGLAKRRKITVLHGDAAFTGANTMQVGDKTVEFKHAIIACGSQAVSLPFLPDDPRVVDSTGALELEDIPQSLLVIGGGIIGLEMATVYDALGSAVTVVELQDQLIPGCDADHVKPLHKRIEGRYAAIHLKTSVTAVEAQDDGLHVTFDGGVEPAVFDRVLVAVGRKPNGARIGADAAGVTVTERGFIEVDAQQRTNVKHIFAIGDVVGEPMLAHKATHEGVTAAEVIAGHDAAFDAKAIPSVAYTDPEIAWMGLTETKAKADGIAYEKASFPWAASGRAIGVGRTDGATKLLVDPDSHRILGAGITGVNAGELIAEAVVALEMGAVAEDIGLSIHPHPTLSETLGFAAEMIEGTATDVYAPKRKR
ncbi:MAG: dihydrolipoamide dehydrogenase [Solirubrobacteraceae bacterium]|nr:dihydrolipoamide dehydrogenase [Solirubrobacteraceae bacterium]